VKVRFAVLLRGVNAGPNNRIDMAALRTALVRDAFDDVSTHLQSGNVALTWQGTEDEVAARVRQVLSSEFGLDVGAVVREADALQAVVAENPLRDVATDPRRHFVVFCSRPHDPARVPAAVPPEALAYRPRELFLWCPHGAAASKLMAALGRKPPAPVTTFRNWNTVTALAHMLEL
jgi:uncharacterized protein (DUF1697 family)